VVPAGDGAAACTAARSERPDLILMDIQLPGLDGLEATRRLKAAPPTRAIPIIGLSCYAMPEDREKALQAGCDEYETKPIDLPALLEKIRRLLNGKASHEQ
jgi:two-component system cell cycle response regulator DivK